MDSENLRNLQCKELESNEVRYRKIETIGEINI